MIPNLSISFGRLKRSRSNQHSFEIARAISSRSRCKFLLKLGSFNYRCPETDKFLRPTTLETYFVASLSSGRMTVHQYYSLGHNPRRKDVCVSIDFSPHIKFISAFLLVFTTTGNHPESGGLHVGKCFSGHSPLVYFSRSASYRVLACFFLALWLHWV